STPRLSPSPIAPRRSSTAAATSAPCTLSLHDALPICLAAVYETFLSVLQVHNFAAVPAGNNMIKIIPTVEARQVAGNDLPRSLEGPADDIVTQVIEVRNVEAAQLVPLLRPLLPQTGLLAAYPG